MQTFSKYRNYINLINVYVRNLDTVDVKKGEECVKLPKNQKERFDNTDLVDQLEQRIRAKAHAIELRLAQNNQIDFKTLD